MQPSVILASTSRYRAELLKRLNIDFQQMAPDCDETPHSGESAIELTARLSVDKAQSIANQYPTSLVIGSDQVANCNGAIIGKPGNYATAVEQLRQLSGQTVSFVTGLCVMQAQSNNSLECLVTTDVTFKRVDDDQIDRYLQTDKPYDCAASFRSEGYGSTIVDKISSDDPTAIIGLPIIRVAEYLDKLGLTLP